ncbi:MAG: T9SS type A sorting domain-containing protein [Bacteroidales bacterium]|nr:T9SS type A sorting domain-containing protein [Bacteroidales bacterium]
MKNRLLTSLFLVPALLLSLQLVAQENNLLRGSEMCAKSKQMRPAPSVTDLRSPNSPRHKFDVLNYELDLDIFHCYSSPYPRNFSGTCLISFKVDSTLNTIELDADNTSLQIISVGTDGTSFNHDDNILTVNLDGTYHAGDTAFVSVRYNHLNVIDYAFNVGNGFVFTDCEPEGARKWFPCYDKPSDKATLNLRAKVPLNVKLGSNGSLADSVVIADSLWYTWVSIDPISTYLMVMTSRVNYNLDIVYWHNPDNPSDSIPMRFYYNPNENPASMEQMIIPLTDFYYSLFGDHPFEKNGFASLNPQFQWGGMENQTLTSLCQGCWYSSLIAHEFAHQWFGDMITCATWADLWLNEGFATYIEALWTGEVSGQQAYINELEGNAAYYLSANPGWPISDPDWATNPPGNDVLFNYAITYMKGSCVLYMYRYVVGDELFFSSLYDYANDTENFRYQTATIPDFIDKMNLSTGQDLNWFFEEWLYQPNHPVYDNSYSFENMGGGSWNVHFYTEQVQTASDFFRMPVELRISFSDASDTIVQVMNDINGQGFTFHFDKQPVSLTFDPRNQIILKQATTVVSAENQSISETILYQPEPNPAANVSVVRFSLAKAGDVKLVLRDLTGKQIHVYEMRNLSAGQHRHSIDLSGLSNGTYIVTMESADVTMSVKMMVVK